MHFASHTLKDSQPVCSHVTASQLMSEQPERVRGTTVTLSKPRKAILAGAEGVPMEYSIFSCRFSSTCQGSSVDFACNWTRIGQRTMEAEA